MSAVEGLGSTPQNDPEWARKVEKRLAALERPGSILMGNWVISMNQYGDLVADNLVKGARTVIAQNDFSTRSGTA